MKPLLINSAMVHAPGWLVSPQASWQRLALKVRYGFFEHPKAGPCLIDTGYTARVTSGPGRSLALRAYAAVLRPQLQPGGPALDFLKAHSIAANDIRTIIATHFHADHVAALKDFPKARIYADSAEWQAFRMRSRLANIKHGIFTELFPADIEERLHFIQNMPSVPLPASLGTGFDLFADGTALTVPLPGHALAQFGILFPQLERPFLYAADAHWLMDEIRPDIKLPILAYLANHNLEATRQTISRLSAFRTQGGSFALCHDPGHSEYDHGEDGI